MSAPIYLRTFADIIAAVQEELKVQASDTVARDRIKRAINSNYLNEVIPAEQWPWLRAEAQLLLDAVFQTGTATVVQNSATVIVTVAPSGSRAGQLFSVGGSLETYRISTHTANSTTFELESPFVGGSNASAAFKIWTDALALPTDARETFEVSHAYQNVPMDGHGLQKFYQYVTASPKAEGRPRVYSTSDFVAPEPYASVAGLPPLLTRTSNGLVRTLTFTASVESYVQAGQRIRVTGSAAYQYNGEFVISSVSGASLHFTTTRAMVEIASADVGLVLQVATAEGADARYRELRVHPAICTKKTILKVSYIKEVRPLTELTDEPLMPISDRIVLVYGALAQAWASIGRSDADAARNAMLFDRKLTKMQGKLDDSTDLPKFRPSRTYLARKRSGPAYGMRARYDSAGDSGGSSAQNNTIINTPNSVAVFNADGELDASPTTSDSALLRLAGTADTVAIYGPTGELAASSAVSVSALSQLTNTLVTVSSAQTVTNKTIDADANTISNIENADIKAAAAIDRSKLATSTADQVLINNGAGAMSSEASLAVVRGGTALASYTAGDILYASAPTTLAKLAAGTSTQVLKGGAAPSWGSPNVAKSQSKSAAYTVLASDDLILADATSGAFTLTLPAAASCAGKILRIIKTDSTFNAVTLDGNASETVDGGLTTTLNTVREALELFCDGANWISLNRRIPSIWTAYSPSASGFGGLGTVTSIAAEWRRIGPKIEIRGRAITGTVTGASILVPLPSGLSVDYSANAPEIGVIINSYGGSPSTVGIVPLINTVDPTNISWTNEYNRNAFNAYPGNGFSNTADVAWAAQAKIAGWNG